ncbi:hypothetical protein PF005_g16410 [Phytophthora fragariae]|uniref:Uncharacterized protein n=2 Tax=Phytophthora fragariae TaxID=53985 RepID=A0A6A3YQ06_9STRA|nr:hypothetical protein PF005_g16410 [Phytophthora fragariae]KAE9221483.1 hypothetical protein PF002_g15569 [Phytophthora fragariae]
MTTETRIIVRPAPDALRAGSPIKPLADPPTPSDMVEKLQAPASKKHSGDPEVAKAASASKKPTNDMKEAKETQASDKRAKDAGEAKKVTASSKPAAKQLPKTKGYSKEGQKTLKLRPSALLCCCPPLTRTLAATRPTRTSRTPGIPSPHPSLELDYEESEPDVDNEVGEVEWSPKQITDAQRVLYPGSPMSPKTVVAVERARLLEASMSRRDDPPAAVHHDLAVERARLLEASMSRRDDPPAAVSEPQVITNAGVDEGVPPEVLQPENRQHLADRTHQEASQAVGTKRDREIHAPRTQDKLLAPAILDSGRVPRASSTESHAWSRRSAVRQVSGRAPGGHRFLPSTE